MATYKLVNADQLDSDLTAVGNAIRSKGGTSAWLSFPAGMVSAIGAISTGVELNFDVVGGTSQPINPKENTIWVNTDKEITGWYFQAKQPASMKNGEVWISTCASSTVEFNALKKNGIQVYPLYANQYISGELVGRKAKIYQNGSWAEWWDGTILTASNEFPNITGGWIADTTTMSAALSGVAPEVYKEENIIEFHLTGYRKSGCYRTKQKVDITGFSSITIDLVSGRGCTSMCALYIAPELTHLVNSHASVLLFDGPGDATISGTFSIDLSSLADGEYYIFLSFANYDTASNASVLISDVKLKE